MTLGSISYGSHLGQRRCVLWRYWAPKQPHWCTCTASCKASSPLCSVFSAVAIPVHATQIMGLVQAGLLQGGVKGRKGCLFPVQLLSQQNSKGRGWAGQDCGHLGCSLPAAQALPAAQVVSNIREERGSNVLFQALVQRGTIFPQHLQCSAGVLNANLWLSFA